MPPFSCSSVVRSSSEQFTLCLEARHHLVACSESEVERCTNTRFPDKADVLLTSDLVLTLSGIFDRVEVPNEDILRSAVASHLIHYLEMNSNQLGLDNVSKIYIDEIDGLPKLLVTSSYCRRERQPPGIELVSIDLRYVWNTVSRLSPNCESQGAITVLELHPFASQLLLPVESILHEAVEKFVSLHLVKRYPLIFGPWCKKLDSESTFFPLIARSVSRVISHSEDPSFQAECQRLINFITEQHSLNFQNSNYHDKPYSHSTTNLPLHGEVTTGEDAICLSMRRLYKICNRRPTLKGNAGKNLMGLNHHDENWNLSCDDAAPELKWRDLSWNDSLASTGSNATAVEELSFENCVEGDKYESDGSDDLSIAWEPSSDTLQSQYLKYHHSSSSIDSFEFAESSNRDHTADFDTSQDHTAQDDAHISVHSPSPPFLPLDINLQQEEALHFDELAWQVNDSYERDPSSLSYANYDAVLDLADDLDMELEEVNEASDVHMAIVPTFASASANLQPDEYSYSQKEIF